LFIAVEDWWFDEDVLARSATSSSREVLELPLQFDAVHIVDKTERLFLTFPLSRGQNGK